MGNLLLFWLLPSTESIFSSKINAHIKVLPFLRGARNTSLVENPIDLTIELSKSRRIGLNTTCGYLKNCLLATKNIKSNATVSSRWCGLGFMMCIRWLVIVSYVRKNNFGTEICVSDVVTTISKYLRTAEALQLAILSNTPPHRRFSLTGFIYGKKKQPPQNNQAKPQDKRKGPRLTKKRCFLQKSFKAKTLWKSFLKTEKNTSF